MNRPGGEGFVWPVRVYYEDTDCGGVVYHARYLHYFERARTEWLRAAGFSQRRLSEDRDLLFVVRRLEIDYLASAHYDDELLVLTHVEPRGAASLAFDQRIRRRGSGAEAGELCRARVQVVAVRGGTMRPCRIPETILREVIR